MPYKRLSEQTSIYGPWFGFFRAFPWKARRSKKTKVINSYNCVCTFHCYFFDPGLEVPYCTDWRLGHVSQMPRCLITANLDSFTTRSAGQKKNQTNALACFIHLSQMLSIERGWFCLNFITLTEETWYPILLQLLHIFCKGQRLLYPGGSSRQIVEKWKNLMKGWLHGNLAPRVYLLSSWPQPPSMGGPGHRNKVDGTPGMKENGCIHTVRSTFFFSLVFILN